MSEILFECANCGATLSMEDSAEGWIVKCPECHYETPIPETGIFPGLQLGSFKLVELLKTSEMGDLWFASHGFVERKTLVKILPRALSQDALVAKRFQREAKNTAKLDHPNIVKWLDYGEANGKYYIATTYLEDSRTLKELLAERGRLSEKEALETTAKMASALSYAWDKFKMVHRNIKPANILLDEDFGNVQLMNFGLSKMVSEDPKLTMQGTLLGSPGYISPELMKRRLDIDCRSDIYSLGATLYQMLAGTRPFEGDTSEEVLEKQEENNLVPIEKASPGISEACARILNKMMAVDRSERYQTWDEVSEDIKGILSPEKAAKKKAKKKSDSRRLKPSKAVPSLEKIAADSLPSIKSGGEEKKNFPWTQLTIASSVIILTAATGLFLFKQHGKYLKQKKLEELAKIEEKKKLRENIAADNARRETEWELRRMEKYKKAYEDALDYAVENKDKPHLVKYHYKKLKTFFKGSPYEEKFDTECERVLSRMEQLELEKRKESVMYSIQNAVAELVREKEYRQAALYYRDYAGDLALETESERRKKVSFYLALAKEREAELAKSKKETDEELTVLVEKEFGGGKAAASKVGISEKEEKKKENRDWIIKPGKLKIAAKIKKDIQNTTDGKEQKIFPSVSIENKSSRPLENQEILTCIVCQSRTNKKEYCLYKVLSERLDIEANSARKISPAAISVPYRNGKESKEDELEYEGCVIAMKDPDGNLLAMHTDSSKLNRIKDKLIAFKEGTFFDRKGVKIIK